eukprot:3152412-Prymnesium_polylepis.1
MVLCGHSVGGYMAVAYTERHPHAVERLILVSPVGVPRPPENLAERRKDAPLLFRLALRAWEAGWGPFPIIRFGSLGQSLAGISESLDGATIGPGKFLMRRYAERRFANYPWVEKEAIASYFYSNLAHADGSWGAVAHSLLLVPGAFARSPLCHRIPRLGSDGSSNVGRWISFIYGDRDWMDPSHAEALKEGEGAADEKCVPMAGSTAVPRIEVARVAGAGHNIPIDNPLGFAEAVLASAGRSTNAAFDGRTFGADHILALAPVDLDDK